MKKLKDILKESFQDEQLITYICNKLEKNKRISVGVLSSYSIEGYVNVTFWGGDKGVLQMSPFSFELGKLTHKKLLNEINDGGFGVRSINSAEIDIFLNYTNGEKIFYKTIKISNPIHTKHFLKF